jgi:hypothetical protein
MPNFGDRGAPASASAAISAASSAKLSDNSSQVNWRRRKFVYSKNRQAAGSTSKIVTALIRRRAQQNSGEIYLSGGRR